MNRVAVERGEHVVVHFEVALEAAFTGKVRAGASTPAASAASSTASKTTSHASTLLTSTSSKRPSTQGHAKSVHLDLNRESGIYPAAWRAATVEQAGVVGLGRQRYPDWHTGPIMRLYYRNITDLWASRLKLIEFPIWRYATRNAWRLLGENDRRRCRSASKAGD